MDRISYQSLRERLNFSFQGMRLCRYLVEDALLWASFIYALQQPVHISWLGAIPFALLMFRNFTFMHEAAHGLAHSNKKLNYLFGMVAGTICFLPYQPWKAIHLDHHVWTGNFEKDPVLEVVKKYPASSRIMKGVFTAMWRTRFPLMAFFQYIVLWGHSAARLLKNNKDIHFWLSFLMPCTAWTVLVLNFDLSQLAVVAGGIALYSFLFDYIQLPHHVGVYTYDPEARTPIWNQHEVARTGRYPALIEYLVMYFNYHAEHHMFPTLPWHELKKAHNIIQSEYEDPKLNVIKAGWLARQRSKTFAQFLRPDLYDSYNPELKKAG